MNLAQSDYLANFVGPFWAPFTRERGRIRQWVGDEGQGLAAVKGAAGSKIAANTIEKRAVAEGKEM